jgi:hypothetical protein
MSMNRIGKFESRRIIDEFDATLIQLFGVNMTDADISRQEAIAAYNEVNCTRKAVEICAMRRGLELLQAA